MPDAYAIAFRVVLLDTGTGPAYTVPVDIIGPRETGDYHIPCADGPFDSQLVGARIGRPYTDSASVRHPHSLKIAARHKQQIRTDHRLQREMGLRFDTVQVVALCPNADRAKGITRVHDELVIRACSA